MALYRDIQFHKGSPTDIMGAVPTLVNVGFVKTVKGWGLKGAYNGYVQYDRQILPDNAFSVVVWAKLPTKTITGWESCSVITSSTSPYLGLHFDENGNYAQQIEFNSVGTNGCRFVLTPTTRHRWYCFIYTINGSAQSDINTSKFYYNNKEIIGTNYIATGAPIARNLYTRVGLVNSQSSTSTYSHNIARLKVYDHVLTSKEREKEQVEFEAAQPLTYQKRLLSSPKPTELKQSGLVAGYNKIRSGIYNDLSASGKHGVVANCLSTVKGIKLHGVNSKVVLGNIGNVKSISFRIKIKTTTQPISEKAANSGLIHVASGTLTSLDFANKYVNGVAGTAITANQWHNVVLTSSSNVAFSAATLGLNNTTYGNFEIEDLRFYSTILSLQEIKAYHNSFNEVILHEQWKDTPVGSSVLPSGWIKNGGSFTVQEATTNDAVLKNIVKGSRYLKCNTSGVVAIPSKQAYGTWEFDWYKGGDTNSIYIGIISNNYGLQEALGTTTGYQFHVMNTEKLRFTKREFGVGTIIIETGAPIPYVSNSTWYRIRITRTTSGTFTIFIKGGLFTNWTLVSTTGGSGTNPVTDTTYNSSSYFVMDLDANDRVTDILIQSQIKA